ncbi:hypothetical protein MLD38_011901 [Melastoma candidum]|uniref:Uncharacterized protein n=1 Tax=Melastoma candidum TaxID=119954 RepID=A0ACB9R4J3_9MYRT|nr:hypothetical protein MLD38_011901 [Melastoma candidum]
MATTVATMAVIGPCSPSHVNKRPSPPLKLAATLPPGPADPPLRRLGSQGHRFRHHCCFGACTRSPEDYGDCRGRQPGARAPAPGHPCHSLGTLQHPPAGAQPDQPDARGQGGGSRARSGRDWDMGSGRTGKCSSFRSRWRCVAGCSPEGQQGTVVADCSDAGIGVGRIHILQPALNQINRMRSK